MCNDLVAMKAIYLNCLCDFENIVLKITLLPSHNLKHITIVQVTENSDQTLIKKACYTSYYTPT